METMRRYKGSTITLLLVIALVICGWWIEQIKVVGHLKSPWVVVMAVLVALCAFAGCLVNRRIDGILIDDRNRISLSRFQWVMWVIIVGGGYFTVALWDVANTGDFPKLDEQTLILLGIVSGSAVLSTVVVNKKKAQPNVPAAPAAANDAPVQVGAADANATVAEASWADLFMGEDAANRYVVDISRLQKLIFTVILALTYLTWLWVVFSKDKTPLEMPLIGSDSNFNWLLGISHLAYQGGKAAPKTPAAGAAPPVQPAP
jgi:hypothetical protein